jgi:hypothetical protein
LTYEVEICEPDAEATLHKMESDNLIKLKKLWENGDSKKPLQFGCMKGLVTYISDDFDAPLEEFEDYM